MLTCLRHLVKFPWKNMQVLFIYLLIIVYLLKLFCSATVPICDIIFLSRARHIRLTSIDAAKSYWDVNSLYRKMTFPKCSAPVCSCIQLCTFTTNVPVVYMGRDVMILMRAARSLQGQGQGRAHWKGWALKTKPFWAMKKQRAKLVPFGLKKVEIFRAHPFRWPE